MLATLLLKTGDAAAARPILQAAREIHGAKLSESHVEMARDHCLIALADIAEGGSPDARQQLASRHPAIANWGLVNPIQRELFQNALQSPN